MKTKILVVGIIGIILLSIGVVYAKFEIFTCDCNCGEERIFAQGLGKTGKIAGKRCYDMCGRSCGSRTDCKDECDSCCESWCSSTDEGKEGCLESCKKTCEFNKMIKGLTDLIYVVAGIVAAIMLIIHSLRFISSQDPGGREDAKKAIFFVIFALIIIGLAGTLVTEFASKVEISGEEEDPYSDEVDFIKKMGDIIYHCWDDNHMDYRTVVCEKDFDLKSLKDSDEIGLYEIESYIENEYGKPPEDPNKWILFTSVSITKSQGTVCIRYLRPVNPIVQVLDPSRC